MPKPTIAELIAYSYYPTGQPGHPTGAEDVGSAVAKTLGLEIPEQHRHYLPVEASGALSEDGLHLLLDVADPTAPNGTRSFILDIREAD